MSNKKLMILMFGLLLISCVSAVKPITSITTDAGYLIEPVGKDYIKTGENHSFEIHVFNKSTGLPITTGITCYMHLYNETGKHQFEQLKTTVDHDFDYGFDLIGNNFTERGEYQIKYQCNSSAFGGGTEIFFWVDDYGEELTVANIINFSFSMGFMMILFLIALFGLFKSENYIVKFTLYWVVHVLFIIGTFSMWQFQQGYAISWVGFAGVWSIMFYVSIFSVLPMMVLSGAWVLYIHTFNEHFQRLVDKGEDPETAFTMAKKKRGGWINGQR